jgi:uncharacterized protein (TIGR03663 family)
MVIDSPDAVVSDDDTPLSIDVIEDPMQIDELVDSSDSAISDHGDEEPVERPRRSRFSPPTREQLLLWAPFWGVILLGAILRFWGLGDKPLHHDESLHGYFSLQLLHTIGNWSACFNPPAGSVVSCYKYDPLLHGPFQFHFIALVYKIAQILGASDNGVNNFTVRILAATLGTAIVGLPYFLRDYLGKIGAWLACLLLAVSATLVYFSRFAREDIYMAFFTMLMVVAFARYVRSRRIGWLITSAAALSFSYATKEATFLTVAVFGSFVAGLIAWELGLKWPLRERFRESTRFGPYLPRTAAPVTLAVFLIVAGLAAKAFFAWIHALSIYVSANSAITDVQLQDLKDKTVAIVPWIGIILGIYVLSILGREMFGKLPPAGRRRGLAKLVDPKQQRMLDTFLSMPWTHWFFALLVAWTIFLVLFTVVFTNIRGGIGDGIWKGIYYWLQQQQVARGGQPWYYYLLLIPLYEQLGVVFGLVGIIRCIAHPTRFRLFLVWWFVGNLFLYSWAAEKMPWLSIHITMPMMLLAAIGLEPIVVTLFNLAKVWYARLVAWRSESRMAEATAENLPGLPPRERPRVGVLAGSTAVFGFVCAVLLLLPSLHNMYEVSYVHAADGPHEMLVYVQTTTDVNIMMQKIEVLDQKLDGGKHQIPIGLMGDATWPFAWYLRDYTDVCYTFPDGCPSWSKTLPPVIISGGDNVYNAEARYSGKTGGYAYHQYHMRTWWDEGYKPLPCIPSKTNSCADQATYGGVGVGLWLSYGDNPPPGAKFNLGLAVQHIWQWWWNRTAIGSTDGAYDMGLFIRNNLSGLGVTP